MTGSLKMTVPSAGSVGYGFQDTSGNETSRIISIANGNVVWQDRTNLIDVLTYSPANKMFTMQADTNLLKKTGDTMTGSLTMNSNINMNFPSATKARSLRWQQDNVDYISMGTNNAGEFVCYDQANAKSIFVYYPATNTFNVNTANTNLVKKSEIYSGWSKPDGLTTTATGSNIDDMTTPGFYSGNSIVGSPLGNGTIYISVWSHSSTYQRQEVRNATDHLGLVYERKRVNGVWGAWVENSGRSKDGRVNLVLTADATNFDTTRAPIVVRRGNTVTLRGAFSLKSDAAGITATTIPDTFRPTDVMTITVLATDGTYHNISIHISGDVNIPATAKGKNIYLQCTYVVN
ncbi:pyocin knob domain-containing protein [Bacillus tropicus]